MRKIYLSSFFMVLAMMGYFSLDCHSTMQHIPNRIDGDNKTLKGHANDFYEKIRRNR